MRSTSSTPGDSAVPECAYSILSRSIQAVIAQCGTGARRLERRRDRRYPFPYPIRLTPVGDDGVTPIGEEIVVLGKHLTEHGLDFYYREPLAQRWVLATFECGSLGDVTLLLELTWCRFGRHGYYENGGRFLVAK
jgi:hypothetical protein